MLFDISAIASVRWLAPAAHAGPESLVLWLAAALLFFVPSGIVVARLSSRFPQHGGLYIWTKQAFGERHAFLCAWFYFLSNLFYFPTLVMFAITMASYLFGNTGVRASETRGYAVPATLLLLWTLFIVNFFGVRPAKWIQAAGVISVLATTLLLSAFSSPIHLIHARARQLLPTINFDSLNFWSQIAFAFVGLELAPILSGELRNPARDIPRAALISGVACSLLYIAGTAAMLGLISPAAISPVTGLAQAGVAAASLWRAPIIATIIIAFVMLATAAQLATWIEGNTRLPYVLGIDHYLPAAFAQVHPRWGTPYVSLIVQAVAASAFLLMAEVGETMRAAYQIMIDMVVIVTFLPFLYIFGSAYRFGTRLAAIPGLAITFLAIVFSLVPPPGVASSLIFEVKVLGGCIVFSFAGLLLCRTYEKENHSQ